MPQFKDHISKLDLGSLFSQDAIESRDLASFPKDLIQRMTDFLRRWDLLDLDSVAGSGPSDSIRSRSQRTVSFSADGRRSPDPLTKSCQALRKHLDLSHEPL